MRRSSEFVEKAGGPARTSQAPAATGRVTGSRANLLGAVFAVVAPLILFIPLAAGAPQDDPASWDARLSRYVHGFQDDGSVLSPVLGAPLRPAFQFLGVGLLLILPLMPFARKRLRLALFVLLTIGGTLVFSPVLKDVFNRPPVDGVATDYSFPSGHAMRSIAIAAALTLVVWPTRFRWPTALLGAAVVAVIGFAVVYHEWHWASDVLGGWCIGVAWVAALYVTVRPVPARSSNPSLQTGFGQRRAIPRYRPPSL
jgi:membrane-associated phospholipid phosphatase